jgi:hypothetical protein
VVCETGFAKTRNELRSGSETSFAKRASQTVDFSHGTRRKDYCFKIVILRHSQQPMERFKVLFSPLARARITHKIQTGKKWKGTRSGARIEFVLSDQPNLSGERVKWRARFQRAADWKQGTAGTVWEAIEQIERMAAK